MQDTSAFPFEAFWHWVTTHPNCILRAGTPEAVLYDDDDLHWHFAAEDASLLVQVIRGKRLIGEIVVDPEQVAYVQEVPGDVPDEHTFELVAESESEPFPAYFFVMAHGWDEAQVATPRRVH